jgi:hypothetical protein
MEAARFATLIRPTGPVHPDLSNAYKAIIVAALRMAWAKLVDSLSPSDLESLASLRTLEATFEERDDPYATLQMPTTGHTHAPSGVHASTHRRNWAFEDGSSPGHVHLLHVWLRRARDEASRQAARCQRPKAR